jgi:hypothetical protein
MVELLKQLTKHPRVKQLGSYKSKGDHLTLMTQPSRDPASGLKTVRTLVWERVK